ncbi:YcaO-like family protein [Legionella shakespearei]|uniref:YcaO-like family protein n=1 Tax=Legionella shakespearei DSM 23087 TaxID=1122169 RepID=A0A0W0YVS0_9GAMM|nr:YcaO-like family protein [Legionella shakespearei]KTD60972.1 YcaO-like family protein [Legionella shakespearei DSM 23087]
MNISHLQKGTGIRYQTHRLLNQLIGKLCGIGVDIGFLSPNSADPNIITSGVYLTGVHHLLNRPDPGRGGYHVGGIGTGSNETLIKSLAETIERYCQLMAWSTASQNYPTRFCSYAELVKKGEQVVSERFFSQFSDNQYDDPEFIFKRFNQDDSIQWIKLSSMLDNEPAWCPAQLLFVGYNCQPQELLVNSAASTGTAAHINYKLALNSAILELIQLDSTMGHWYTDSPCYEIKLDDRTSHLAKFMSKHARKSAFKQKFYLLPNPDMPGFSVACLWYRDHDQGPPYVSIGLGIELSLEQAMFKAYLEGYSIVNLARMLIYKRQYMSESVDEQDEFCTEQMFDLNANITYYSLGKGKDAIARNFLNAEAVQASSLSEDLMFNNIDGQLRYLISAFRENDKQLYYVDLTSSEVQNFGLKVPRVWSPDLLTLCLPSTPPLGNPRFKDYGSRLFPDPHPYP